MTPTYSLWDCASTLATNDRIRLDERLGGALSRLPNYSLPEVQLERTLSEAARFSVAPSERIAIAPLVPPLGHRARSLINLAFWIGAILGFAGGLALGL